MSRKRGSDNELRPDRAVIDIGSNTVRLVMYAGSQRTPRTWLNEKVAARLGRDLSETGTMPGKAVDQALAALARYALVLADHRIGDVQTVATAAVRDADNGTEFLEKVRALGLSPRLLSGEDEAQGSAFGVIGAFPGARGTVADLGGGSLELVMVEDEDCHDGCSLPLGTLRLPALRKRGPDGFRKAIEKELANAGWAATHPGPLYMVGGTWRALAAYAMDVWEYPLTDPHAYTLSPDDAENVARDVAKMTPDMLSAKPGISASRAAGLPDAAAMLRVMLAELEPESVVFSSWGLREGLLFQRLAPDVRAQDPLLEAVAEFAGPRGASRQMGESIAAWTAEAVGGGGEKTEKLRLAATLLCLAAVHVEPNLRVRHAFEWAMDKRWVGLDAEGRARIAAALLAACGKAAPPAELERLATAEALHEAIGWGLAIRLARRLGAGSDAALRVCRLERTKGKLALVVSADRAQSVSDKVVGELKNLAHWLNCEHELQVVPAATPGIGGAV
jgi:exopolyphosphatase / guanosine-5'-triphosphate,3'-diphosphate pyrophosphatase